MTVDVYENCPIYENEYYMLRMASGAVLAKDIFWC